MAVGVVGLDGELVPEEAQQRKRRGVQARVGRGITQAKTPNPAIDPGASRAASIRSTGEPSGPLFVGLSTANSIELSPNVDNSGDLLTECCRPGRPVPICIDRLMFPGTPFPTEITDRLPVWTRRPAVQSVAGWLR